MNKKSMLLFGGSGMLGTRICELLSLKYFIYAPTHRDVNLTSIHQIESLLEKKRYDVVVYSAGITNQDEAEEKKDLALELNYKSAGIISKKLNLLSTPFIYFSTDAVFGGNKDSVPHTESAKVNPVNFYGKTKALGEEIVLESSTSNAVIRLISVYTPFYPKKTDFSRKMLKCFASAQKYGGIVDQYFNPTYSDDAISILEKVIDNRHSGIFHMGAVDCISNYEFARLVAASFGYEKDLVVPIRFKDFQIKKKVNRGKFCCLDVTLSRKVIGEGIYHTNYGSVNRFKNDYLKHF